MSISSLSRYLSNRENRRSPITIFFSFWSDIESMFLYVHNTFFVSGLMSELSNDTNLDDIPISMALWRMGE
ncbi:hypothetical protein AYI68_g5164 [Smittium mucronatum]|uniref:Uncharacterized protein n=1 Tax=Smittium mucronatum TaxID=133383 RepID=A0A1R0GV37_9FUNG|nr:hypothetical protein AYI68_g5164 [Smittium mucronatum]